MGTYLNFTVPPHVPFVTITAWGAQGGGSTSGGFGGMIQAHVAVRAFEVLFVYVGSSCAAFNPSCAHGGYNGGGNADAG